MEKDPDLYTYDNCYIKGEIVNGEWKYEHNYN